MTRLARFALRRAFPDWFTPGRFLVFLALLIAASYPMVLLGLETFYYRDYGVLAYPTIYHHRESFWLSEVPLWNPLSHCGVPFLAQWGTMVLYPLSLVYCLLPLPWSLGVFCLGHLWLGGAGMYFLASRWTGHSFGAAVGGIAYAFGGLTLSSLMWPNWTAALAWLPWVVFCGEQAAGRSKPWLVHLSVSGTFQMLTGVPEVVLLTWLIVVLLWALAAIRAPRNVGRLVARGGVVVVLVTALSAAQLFPFLDLIGHSQRQAGFSDMRWSMPLWGWANLVVPLFHCFETPQGTFSQQDQAFFTSYYPGLLTLALSIAGCWRLETARQRLTFLLLLAGLFLALGPQGYVYEWVRKFVPSVGLGRFPIKFFVLGGYAVPVLAAFTVASLQSGPNHIEFKSWKGLWICAGGLVLTGMVILCFGRANPFPFDQWNVTARNFTARVVGLVVGLALLWPAFSSKIPKIRNWAALAVLIAVWIDLRFHWPAHNPTLSSSVMAPGITKLSPKPRPMEARILIAPWAGEQLLHSRVEDPMQDFLGKRLAMFSNLNLLEGIPNAGGAMTLRLRHQEEVHKRIQDSPETDFKPLLDYLAVAQTTASNNPVEWQPRVSPMGWVSAGQRPVYVASDARALEGISEPFFNPSLSLILPATAKDETQAIERNGEYDLLIEPVTAQHFRILIDAQGPTLVSVAQSFHPGWRAEVGGQPTQIWRANHAFQAIKVPAGRNLVVMRYFDRWFLGGGVASIAALVICAFTLISSRSAAWRPGTP